MVDHGETLSAAADRSRWGDYHDDLALPLGHWNAPSSRRPRTVIPSTPGPAVALSSRGPLAAGRPCGADSAFGSSQVEFSRVAWGLRRHSHGTREKGCYQVAQRPSSDVAEFLVRLHTRALSRCLLRKVGTFRPLTAARYRSNRGSTSRAVRQRSSTHPSAVGTSTFVCSSCSTPSRMT